MAEETISIRRAEQDDSDELIRLSYESAEFHRRARPDVFIEYSFEELKKSFNTYFSDDKTQIFLAEADSVIVGLLRFRIFASMNMPFLLDLGPEQAIIEELVVSEKFKRQGIGKKMVCHAETEIHKKGIRAIHLNVFDFNLGAQQLYKSIDYKPSYSHYTKILE